MANMKRNKAMAQQYIECEICYNYSEFYCKTCNQRICKQCRDAHLRAKANKNHEVVLYQERYRRKELLTEKCAFHRRNILRDYCTKCTVAVCSECIKTDHYDHELCYLEVGYDECLQKTQKLLKNIKDTILPNCIKEVESQQKIVMKYKEKILKLRSSMKQDADDIKARIDGILEDQNAKLDKTLEEISEQEKKSNDHLSFLRTLTEGDDMSSRKPTQVIALSKELSSITQKTIPKISEPHIPTFTKGRLFMEEIEKMCGYTPPWAEEKIQKETGKQIDDSAQKYKEMEESPQSYISKPTTQLRMQYSNVLSKIQEFNISGLKAICHLSPVSPSDFWASDDDGNLIQAAMNGQILQTISTKKSSKGFHTITQEGDLLYTDYMNKGIYRVHNKEETKVFNPSEDWEPWTLCSTRMFGYIILGMKKNKKWKITRFDKGGKQLQDIQKNDKGEDLYSNVSFITENVNGDICTSDFNACRVVVVSKWGKYRFSYSGSSTSLQFHPYGICTDVFGNILVCNGYKNSMKLSPEKYSLLGEFGIHLIDRDGLFLSVLLEGHQSAPYVRALCVYDQHTLMVGSALSPTVTVYKYSQSKDSPEDEKYTTSLSDDPEIQKKSRKTKQVENAFSKEKNILDQFKNTYSFHTMNRLYFARNDFSEVVIVAVVNDGTSNLPESFKGYKVICKLWGDSTMENRLATYSKQARENPLTDEQLNMLGAVIMCNNKDLMANHSNLEVISVSPVLSRKNGTKIIICPCIVLYCSQKGAIPIGERRFPKILDGVRIDVREGFFYPCPRDGDDFFQSSKVCHEHIRMGCNIGREGAVSTGTLGGFVDIGNGDIGFITCAHVLHPNLPISPTDKKALFNVVQPGYGINRTNHICGVHLKSVCPSSTENNSDNITVDASLIKVNPDRKPERGLFAGLSMEDVISLGFTGDYPPEFQSGKIRDLQDPTASQFRHNACFKIGAASGFTKGLLSCSAASYRHTSQTFTDQRNTCIFHKQLEITPIGGHSFAIRGDSGAFVYQVETDPHPENEKMVCIGMLTGVNSVGQALVTPIREVLVQLGIQDTTKVYSFPKESMDIL